MDRREPLPDAPISCGRVRAFRCMCKLVDAKKHHVDHRIKRSVLRTGKFNLLIDQRSAYLLQGLKEWQAVLYPSLIRFKKARDTPARRQGLTCLATVSILLTSAHPELYR
jgi:hypothetical protein